MISNLRLKLRRWRVRAYLLGAVGIIAYGSFLYPWFWMSAAAACGFMMLIVLQDHFSNPNYHWTDGTIEVLAIGTCGMIVLTGFQP